jgi:hypothetical protein
MIYQKQLVICVALVMFFVCCANESDVLTEKELKTYCNVYPVYVQVLESDREFFIKMISQCKTPLEPLTRIHAYIKGRPDFPEIDNRMKALGMSFDQFCKTQEKVSYAYSYYHLYGDQGTDEIDSQIKISLKALTEAKSSEEKEAIRGGIELLKKLKTIPKENIELIKKYDDVVTDLMSKPSW